MASVRRTQRHSGGIPDSLLSREPGVTRAFFQDIDHLETLVDSLDRLLRLVGASNKPPSSGSSRVCRCPRVTSASVFDSFATASLTATRTSSAGWAGPRYRDLPTRCRRDRTATAQARVIWPACSNRFTTTCGRLSKSRHSDGLPRTSAPATGISSPVAEGVGFEPTVDQTAHNGFRDRVEPSANAHNDGSLRPGGMPGGMNLSKVRPSARACA
jgi:hypothetical protein